MDFLMLLIKETAHFFVGLYGFLILAGVTFLIEDGVNKLVRWCVSHIPFVKIGQFAHGLWLKVKREEK